MLILGDCIEEMKKMDDNSIDLCLTSPPYDNLRSYNNQEPFTFDKFKEAAKELFRITKNGGVVVWVVADATVKGSETGTSFRQALYFKEIGFRLHDTMIYQKDACPFPETNRYYPLFEYMFILSKGKPNTANLIADKPNKKYGSYMGSTDRQKDGTLKPSNEKKRGLKRKVKQFGVRGNVWLYSPGNGKSTKDKIAWKHPAIFPEQLASDHIKTWSNEGDIVFDPLMGSGTVGKMAKILNRQFIGIEKDTEYFEIAKKRINDA